MEHAPLWKRCLLAVVIVLTVIAFVFLINRFLDEAAAQPKSQTIEFYSDLPIDMRLLQLDKRALDAAYHQQLLKLWGVWLADGAKDSRFFQNGLTNTRRAYNIAAKQISDRKSVLFEHEQRRQEPK